MKDAGLARALAPLMVAGEGNRSVTLGSLWATAPAVVAFVRHFG